MKRLTLKNLISSFPDDASAPAGMTCEKNNSSCKFQTKTARRLARKIPSFLYSDTKLIKTLLYT